MTPTLRLLVPALCLAFVLAGCSGNEKDSFFNVDHDKDGKVIFEEILFVFPNMTKEQFENYDADHSGDLGEREYAAYLAGAPALVPREKGDPPLKAGPAEPGRAEETVVIEVLPAPPEAPKDDRKASKTKPGETKKAEQASRSADAARPSSYTVQRGDTLTRIARNFGLTVDDIIKANGNMKPDTLRDGQVLAIPPKP